MGQKVNPIGFRVAVNKNWRSRWYAERRQYADFFHEDLKIRALIMKRLAGAAVPEVIIERYANRVRATIFTARPGIVIGRGGQRVDETRVSLEQMIGKKVQLNIREIPQPEYQKRVDYR